MSPRVRPHDADTERPPDLTDRTRPVLHVSTALLLAITSLILLHPGSRPAAGTTANRGDVSPTLYRGEAPVGLQAGDAGHASAAPSFREGFGGLWRSRWRIRELADESTTHGVVIDRDNPVLQVESRGSATLFWRPVTMADHAAAWIAWRWRILSSNLPAHRDTRRRSGDDYAARVFVLFGDGDDAVAFPGEDPLGSASRALCYVWADGEPMGSLYRSPYADRVVTIVLQTGPPTDDGWARERRDLAADFRTAFGDALPPVTAVALMVDTDDTGSRATTRFDDVELRFSSP